VKDLPGIITWSIPGFVLLMVLEIVSYRVHRDDDELGYVAKDTATSLTMGIGNVVSDAPWKVPIVAAYPVVYAFEPERERPVYGPGWRPAAVATVSVGRRTPANPSSVDSPRRTVSRRARPRSAAAVRRWSRPDPTRDPRRCVR